MRYESRRRGEELPEKAERRQSVDGRLNFIIRALKASTRGCPTIGGALADVHVTPGYGPWKPTFSRSAWNSLSPELKDEVHQPAKD